MNPLTPLDPIVRFKPAHRAVTRIRPSYLFALLVLLGNPTSFQAQQPSAPAATNEVSQTQEATDTTQGNDAVQEDQMNGGTNNVADTNQTVTVGPDGRTRRQRRRPQTRPGSPGPGRTGSASNSTNSGPSSLDYSAFRLVMDRNIFDPNRAPRSSQAPSGTPKSTDAFTLVGTMSYEKGTFAFFDGTSSDYKKAVKTNDTIAGYQVTAISNDSVKLAQTTNQLELTVGSQMRRQDDGTWTITNNAESYASASNGASSSSSASSAADNDVLKKLMLRREKE